MNFIPTEIPDVLLTQSKVFQDERGVFMEIYKNSEFERLGFTKEFTQDNYSFSKKNVLRGLHYQESPYEQGKLVTVLYGKILDVAVDLRRSSRTFKKWVLVELSTENGSGIYIPPGFAHGFFVLSDHAVVFYKCTREYNSNAEKSILWNDPELNISWPTKNPLVSKKDMSAPLLKDALLFN